jgi:hypothetical protein
VGRGSREAARFKQGNRHIPIDVMGYAEKRADLSDEASVFRDDSGRQNSVVGAVPQRIPRLGAFLVLAAAGRPEISVFAANLLRTVGSLAPPTCGRRSPIPAPILNETCPIEN